MNELRLTLPPELVEVIAERVADLLADRQAGPSPWMTRGQAASYLGVPVSRLEKDRTVPSRKWDGRRLYHRVELDGWLERFRDGER